MQLPPRKGGVAVLLALFVGAIPLIVTMSLPPPGWEVSPPPYSPVTSGDWNDRSPVWSPDGQLIAYVSDRGGGLNLRVENPDGSSDKQLSKGTNVSLPAWSPDSSSIAFIASQGSSAGIERIFTANSTVVRVSNATLDVLPIQPRWSPDGKKILFFVKSDVALLVSADVITGSVDLVSKVFGNNVSADWISNDLVVYSTLLGGYYQIDMSTPGTGVSEPILNGTSNYVDPVAIPNSTRIAYVTNEVPVTEYDRRYPCPYLPGDYNVWVIDVANFSKTFQAAPVPISHGVEETFEAPYTPGKIAPDQRIAANIGNVIAYVASSSGTGQSLYLWDSGRIWTTMSPVGPTNSSSTDLSWSSDRVNLAFAAVNEGHYHIFVLNSTGLILRMPPGEI